MLWSQTLIDRGVTVIHVGVEETKRIEKWRALVKGWPGRHVLQTTDELLPHELRPLLNVTSFPSYIVWQEGKGMFIQTVHRNEVERVLNNMP